MSVETFEYSGTHFATVIRANYHSDGIQFFTPSDYSQQLGYMNRPAGYRIGAHKHKDTQRNVSKTQEVLFVKSGKILVSFYGDDRRECGSTIIETGDVLLLANGGHGFRMITDSEIIEVKQGPYVGEEDKVRF